MGDSHGLWVRLSRGRGETGIEKRGERIHMDQEGKWCFTKMLRLRVCCSIARKSWGVRVQERSSWSEDPKRTWRALTVAFGQWQPLPFSIVFFHSLSGFRPNLILVFYPPVSILPFSFILASCSLVFCLITLWNTFLSHSLPEAFVSWSCSWN